MAVLSSREAKRRAREAGAAIDGLPLSDALKVIDELMLIATRSAVVSLTRHGAVSGRGSARRGDDKIVSPVVLHAARSSRFPFRHDHEVVQFLERCWGECTIVACRSEGMGRFGVERMPSVSAIHRFWQWLSAHYPAAGTAP